MSIRRCLWSSRPLYVLPGVILSLVFWAAAEVLPPTNWSASPFNPPSLPLAVKTPYLNAWAPLAGGSAAVNAAWPRSYLPLINILEWYASIRIDGTAYKLLGEVNIPNVLVAAQKQFIFTPTQTSYLLDCGGKVSVNMTFITPIEATDLVRLSTPFSYLQVIAASSDGQAHSVQVYSDVSGAWISGDINQVSSWAVDNSDEFQFVSLQRQLVNPLPFTESGNRPQDATVYYAAHKTGSLSWQIGPSLGTRSAFANGTKLNNAVQMGESIIGPPSDTNVILGLAIDLGTVQSQSNPAVFALGIVRDPVIRYTNGQGKTETRTAYYWSQLPNINNVIADVLNHFPDALNSANALDTSLSHAAQTYGSDYANLLSLSTRQAMGAIEYTILKDPTTGEFDTTNVKAFMKDMGCTSTGVPNPADGSVFNPSAVNPVDVMYAAMPAYLYLNPNILGYLLSPLLEYQDSDQYPNSFAAQNLGIAFPNATGNSKGHNQGIEQSANMLIMTLAHAQTTGNGSLLTQHYNLLSRWTDYLINNAMHPAQQSTSFSDSISNNLASLPDQTNLALKGIIGIAAMGKIAGTVKQVDDQNYYNHIASEYASQWQSMTLKSGRPVDAFDSSNPGFLYNLFADGLLGLDLIDPTVYDGFTALLHDEILTSQFGVPLDQPSTMARADWLLFAAAIVTDSNVRGSIVNQVVRYNSQSLLGANQPFLVVYNSSTGDQGPVSQGSPAVGAMFAPLALGLENKLVVSNSSSSGGQGNGTNNNPDNEGDDATKRQIPSGAIAGATIGGVALVAGLLILGVFLHRRRVNGRRQKKDSMISLSMEPKPFDLSQQGYEPQPLDFLHQSGHSKLPPFGQTNGASDPFSAPRLDSNVSSGGGPSLNPPMAIGSWTSSSISGGNTIREGTRSATSAQDSRILSEMSRIREEIAEMRTAVEQGQMPPPGYYEELMGRADTSLLSGPQGQVHP